MYTEEYLDCIDMIHEAHFCIDKNCKDICAIEAILSQEYGKAEHEIDIKLYQKGYIRCNGSLEKVEEAKRWKNNPLIQKSIVELENEIAQRKEV